MAALRGRLTSIGGGLWWLRFHMADRPPRERATPRELVMFYLKLVALLAGLSLFGFVVFLMRRSLGH